MRCRGVIPDVPVARPAIHSATAAAAAGGGLRPPSSDFKFLPAVFSDSRPSLFNKVCPSVGWSKTGIQLENHRMKTFRVKALEASGESQTPIAPLQFESPMGQLLSQIMQTDPHLLPAAVDQQLERLQSDRNALKEEKPPSSQQNLLYKRIAEVKGKEKRISLEEIIYCLIVNKFMENNISMIPRLAPSTNPTVPVDSWPNQEQKLEAVHSSDALEMIQSYQTLILRDSIVGPLNTVVQISKLKIGKLYAASIMYGYFLKRVDQRYQLERSMNTLPERNEDSRMFEGLKLNPLWDLESMVQITSEDDVSFDGEESYRLNSYVKYLDAETLQNYATIRSKESISLVEKQTQALFGKPDIRIAEDGSLNTLNDEFVGITFSGLTMLILEAVAFGSFLWEAETYVESKYQFLKS